MEQLGFVPVTNRIFRNIHGAGGMKKRVKFGECCASMTIVSASLNVKGVAGIVEAILGDWRGERHVVANYGKGVFRVRRCSSEKWL